MRLLTFALVAAINCFLNFNAQAATLETASGVPVLKDSISADLVKAVANFEKDNIFVFDEKNRKITDIFISADAAYALNYTISDGRDSIVTFTNNSTSVKSAKLAACVGILKQNDIASGVGIVSCKDELYLSLTAMVRVNDVGNSITAFQGNSGSGIVRFSMSFTDYVLRFEVTPQDLNSRLKLLEAAKRAAGVQQIATIEIQEDLGKPESEGLAARVKNATTDPVMLDGHLALPVTAVSILTGQIVYRKYDHYGCVFVKVINLSEDKTNLMCDEEAWTTTNFVPKVLSGQLYAPVAVLNGTFKGIAFQHDTKLSVLKVKLTLSQGRMEIIKIPIRAKLAIYKTRTRGLIYPYTRDSMPKCTNYVVNRVSYRLTLSVGENFNNVHLNLTNNSNSVVQVVWDETVLRMPSGDSTGIIHEGIRYSERSSSQANTPVAPSSNLEDFMIPKATIRYSDFLEKWQYKLFNIVVRSSDVRNSITVFGYTQTVSGVLTLIVGNKKVYENFSLTCTVKPGEYRF